MSVKAAILAIIAVLGFAGSSAAATFDDVTVDRSTSLFAGSAFLQLDPFNGVAVSTFGPTIQETGTANFFSASLTFAPDGTGFVDIFDTAAFPPASAVAGPVSDEARAAGLWSFLFSDSGAFYVADLSSQILPVGMIGDFGVDPSALLTIYGAERMASAEIPLPAAGWLMLAALGALRLGRHRRN